MNSLILFIVGPTAAGKSKIALELAKRLNGEIISADSMQVYRGMDIGTSKPGSEDRKAVPHHLIDILDPTELYSAYDFRRLALAAVEGILKRKKFPLVAGGTGLYIRSLLKGISGQPGASKELREHYEKIAAAQGVSFLYQELERKDPERAGQISSNDKRRMIRALEILEGSGAKPSDLYRSRPSLKSLGYEPVVIGLTRERGEVYRLIDERVEKMFKNGLVEEAQKLFRLKLSKTASQAVGYKEFYEVWNRLGSDPKGSDPIKDEIKKNTRHLAKRQWTWFKKEEGIQWVDASQQGVEEKVLRAVKHSNF